MRITSKGQVTVPKYYRDKLGVKPGDDIGFREEGQTVIVFNQRAQKANTETQSLSHRLSAFGAKLESEGLMEPLCMTVDQYMEELRGYSDDANDPGFQHPLRHNLSQT